MSNRNFNKQVVPARTKLAMGGPAGGKDDPRRNLGPRKLKPRPMPITPRDPRDKMEPRRPMKSMPIKLRDPRDKMEPSRPMKPMPIKPRDPRDKMEPRRPMPKLPLRPKKPQLTPEQMEKLRELFKKRRKKKTKSSSTKRDKRLGLKLGGGSSSSSREAMIHGFYNKDMGMKKKKK